MARTRRAATVLRADVTGWLTDRRSDHTFARFAGHFRVLDHVLGCMLDAVDAELVDVDVASLDSGEVYDRCRATDGRLALVRRTHAWYADKYDQRTTPGGPVLRAADEVVRSCWAEAFAALDRTAPTGPLVYLDARFDATATPRVSVPSDLRAPGDTVVGEFVRELPIPVIALPALCVQEPWWLVLAAHETGHHVQHDLAPGLVAATRDALAAAAQDDDRAACWSAWAMEAFADAFAALTVGPAAAWAVDELQHAGLHRLLVPPSPGSRYPPPPVRVALLGELARATGAVDAGPGAAEVLEWLAGTAQDRRSHDEVAAHVGLTPRMAATLVELPVDGVVLRDVCGWEPDVFVPDGPVDRWGRALAHAAAPAGRTRLAAARHGIAGGVAAYRTLLEESLPAAGAADPLDGLRATLPGALATCGPSGHLAAGPAPDLDEVSRRLSSRLLAVHLADDGGILDGGILDGGVLDGGGR